MSSVTDIEFAIQKLSVSEQRTIALHLGERLIEEEYPGGHAAADEGIPFLPQHEPCPSLHESLGQKPRQKGQAKH